MKQRMIAYVLVPQCMEKRLYRMLTILLTTSRDILIYKLLELLRL